MIAPGADPLVVLSLEKNMYASKTPRPGPGFASIIYMMERPSSAACSAPIGVNNPWLMALFKNNTFAGSIKIPTRGRRLCSISTFTPAASTVSTAVINGPIR